VLLISAPSGLEEAFFALSQPARRLETRLDAPAIDPAHLVATFAKAGLTFRSPNAVEPVTQPNPALVVRPKPGFSRWYFGHLLTPLLNGSQTGGRLTLNELLIRRGQEPPPHVHFGEDEGYYLLDGQITFHCEEHSYVAQTGDFVFLPRGLAHWYHIHTETGRFLLFTTPSGLENYFMEHSQPAEALVLPPRPANAYAPELMSRARVKYGLEYLPAGAETLGH
ncbi:MAG TPA: cupin domain-containing protein, partial [Clostridia bacterium]|nr:cupin domain-containing protein [Clostridia bacterium]